MNTNAELRATLQHVLATRAFDYLLRTNTSAYVHLPGLSRFVAGLESRRAEGVYGGLLGEKSGTPYASGAGVLMSRDVVAAIAGDRAWEYAFVDDVALGRSAQRLGIRQRPISRIDVSSPTQAITDSQLRSTYLVRCRGERSRRDDIAIMRRVHARFLRLEQERQESATNPGGRASGESDVGG